MMAIVLYVTLVVTLCAALAAVVGWGAWPGKCWQAVRPAPPDDPRCDRDQRAIDDELARPRPRGMSEP